MSRKAVFFNGGAYEDPVNKDNIYISYYSYGGVISLGLDLMLRTKFENITLDDYLREIWNKFGKSETHFNNEDLKNLLSKLTKDEKFTDNFFERYIYGKELPDLTNLLSYAGLKLRKKRPGKASLGRNSILKYQADTTVLIDKPVLSNEPLYAAGLDRGDIILKIDNKPFINETELKNILESHKPGDIVNIEFKRRSGEACTGAVKFEENKELEVVPYEITSLPVTPEILNFRKKWLGSKSDFHNPDLVKKDPETERIFPFEYNYCPYTGRKLLIKLRSKNALYKNLSGE
jgi:predicted metalloprotease with PDZ domain